MTSLVPFALALVAASVVGWFVWQDARPLIDRLVAIRERESAQRLALAASAEARRAAERAVELPGDIEATAAQWSDAWAQDAHRTRAREAFAAVRPEVADDAEAWRRVRLVLTEDARA